MPAGALTFTLYLLGRHPDIQDRVAADGDLARAYRRAHEAYLRGLGVEDHLHATASLTCAARASR